MPEPNPEPRMVNTIFQFKVHQYSMHRDENTVGCSYYDHNYLYAVTHRAVRLFTLALKPAKTWSV